MSSLGFPLLICISPVVVAFFIMFFFIKEFKFFRGIFAILSGLFVVVPIAALQFFLEGLDFFHPVSLFEILLKSILINGIVEETMKMGVLFLFPAKDVRLKVFFFCAVLSGISLGCFESIVYVASGAQSLGLRLITALVVHACCSGLSSLFVYSVKNNGFNIFSFIMAIILHGVYNYFAGFKMDSFFFWFSFVVVIVAIIECRIRYRAMNPDGLILFQ